MVGRIFRRPSHRCRVEIGSRNIRHGEEEGKAKGQRYCRSHAIHKHCSERGSSGKTFLLSIVAPDLTCRLDRVLPR